MVISILEEGISVISKLFLNERLRTWWTYHKIDRQITRQIKDTCEDEGVDFDEFLNRLGTTEAVMKKRSKKLKKSFKEKKTFTGIESFINKLVDTYLESFLRGEPLVLLYNPLNSKERNLVEKIKRNTEIFLTNFKPAETIANININLNKIEVQNREHYDKIMQNLDKLSSQSENLPENLNLVRLEVENALNTVQHGQSLILEKLDKMTIGQKVTDTVSFNELIDVKIGFSGVNFKEKSIGVEDKYTIKLVVDSKILFQVSKISVNREPVNALIIGKEVNFDSQKDGYYIFNLPEVIDCGVGTNFVATINIIGPKPNFKYELYIMLEGQVKVEDILYPIRKSKGPFAIERGSELEVLGNIALGMMDTIFDTKISDTIKKIKDKADEERYF